MPTINIILKLDNFGSLNVSVILFFLKFIVNNTIIFI